jgi:hypothetical protein
VADRLAGWVVGWMGGWLVDRVSDSMVGWVVGWLDRRLIGWLGVSGGWVGRLVRTAGGAEQRCS